MNTVPTVADVMETDYYARGLAVCETHILTDTIYFRFRQEEYELPSRQSWGLVKRDQSRFNSAPIKKVRALAKKLRNANG